jgi:hypothetical protein
LKRFLTINCWKNGKLEKWNLIKQINPELDDLAKEWIEE